MSEHDQLRELAGPYALGTLIAGDREAFARHLPLCPECQRETEDARMVAFGLGQAVDAVDPPPALRARVMRAAAERDRADEGAGLGRDIPKRAAVPWWLGAAAALVAVVAGVVAFTAERGRQAAETEARHLRGQVDTLEQQVAALQMQTAGARQALDVLTAADMRRVDLAAQPAAPGASGRVYWSAAQGLLFSAADLPPLPQGRIYQLWVVTKAAPVSAALIVPDGSGRFSVITKSPPGVQPAAFALTIEPDGGVPAPTGAMYLLGSL